MNSTKNKEQDALVMVHRRNDFYEIFSLALAVYFLSLIVIAISVEFVLIFLIQNPTRPLFFIL